MEELQAWLFFIRFLDWGGWYAFTIVSLALYGVYHYALDKFVKGARLKHAGSLAADATVLGNTTLVALLSGLYILWAYRDTVRPEFGWACILGTLQGILFLLLNIYRFRARNYFPQHVVLPVTRSSVLLVVLFSWFAFGEFASVTFTQVAGLTLTGMSIYLFGASDADSRANGAETPGPRRLAIQTNRSNMLLRPGVSDLAMATVVSAGIALLAKGAVGTSQTNIAMFMFFSNCASAFAGFGLILRGLWRRMRFKRDSPKTTRPHVPLRRCVLLGLLLGVVNLMSYGCLLKALSLSSASVIIPMHSLYIVIPLLLSAVIDGTKINRHTTVAVVLAILSVMIFKT